MSKLLSEYARNNGIDIEAITSAFMFSEKILNDISFESSASGLEPEQQLVIFGSLGRGECNSSSDLDWLGLKTNAATSNKNVEAVIDVILKKYHLSPPSSSSKLFGKTINNTDLYSHIGGEGDTNASITRRILMLLESVPASHLNEGAKIYNDSLDQILEKYLQNDPRFNHRQDKIPRFLLNDIIRYWRTICVDFAYKQTQSDNNKWAIRTIKLRMSRKLLYCKGLMMCISCFKNATLNEQNIVKHLLKQTQYKPLEYFVKISMENGVSDKLTTGIVDNYNKFLSMIGDKETREELSSFSDYESASKNTKFQEMKKIAEGFQSSLNGVFLTPGTKISEFTNQYVIF